MAQGPRRHEARGLPDEHRVPEGGLRHRRTRPIERGQSRRQPRPGRLTIPTYTSFRNRCVHLSDRIPGATGRDGNLSTALPHRLARERGEAICFAQQSAEARLAEARSGPDTDNLGNEFGSDSCHFDDAGRRRIMVAPLQQFTALTE